MKQNQLKGKSVVWKVQLFGIPDTLAQFIKCPQDYHSERS